MLNWRVWIVTLGVKVVLAVVLGLLLDVSKAHALSYVSAPATDTTTGAYIEGLLAYKATQNNTYTVSEASVMPKFLDMSVGSQSNNVILTNPNTPFGTSISWMGLASFNEPSGTNIQISPCASGATAPCGFYQVVGSNSGTVIENAPPGPDLTKGNTEYEFASCASGFGSTVNVLETSCSNYLDAAPSTGSTQTWAPSGCTTSGSTTTCTFVSTCRPQAISNAECTKGSSQSESFTETSQAASNTCPGADFAQNVPNCTGTQELPNGSSTGDPMSEAQEVPLADANLPVSDTMFAYVANNAWTGACSESGYDGYPCTSSNAITTADVDAYNETLPAADVPDVQDLVASPASPGLTTAPSGSASPTTFTGSVDMPNVTEPQGSSPGGTTSGTPSSGTTTTNVNVTANGAASSTVTENGSTTTNVTMTSCGLTTATPCEVDLGTAPPTPTDPTAGAFSGIASGISSLFPGADGYQIPTHTAVCDPGGLTWIDGTYVSFQPFCDRLEDERPLLTPIFTVLWTISAIFVAMSA